MTKPQMEMLVQAVNYRKGRLSAYGTQLRTIEMLSGEGLIVRDYALSEQERVLLSKEIDTLITDARRIIGDDWEAALDSLKKAKNKCGDWDRKCWWVTDKAHRAVAAAGRLNV
jgi:hypothetical protein